MSFFHLSTVDSLGKPSRFTTDKRQARTHERVAEAALRAGIKPDTFDPRLSVNDKGILSRGYLLPLLLTPVLGIGTPLAFLPKLIHDTNKIARINRTLQENPELMAGEITRKSRGSDRLQAKRAATQLQQTFLESQGLASPARQTRRRKTPPIYDVPMLSQKGRTFSIKTSDFKKALDNTIQTLTNISHDPHMMNRRRASKTYQNLAMLNKIKESLNPAPY